MTLRILMAALLLVGWVKADTLSIVSTNSSVSINQMVNLDVSIQSPYNLFAYQFDLSFDPTILQVLSISEGNYLQLGGPTLFFPGQVDNVGGGVTFIADSLEGLAGVSGSGTLVGLSFEAIAPGVSSIDLQNIVLLDDTLSGIGFDLSNGTVSVAPVPEPSPASLLGLGLVCILLGRLRFPSRLACALGARAAGVQNAIEK